MNFEKYLANPKEEALQKISKKLAAFVAAGIITFGSGTEIIEATKGDYSAENYIKYSEKYLGDDEVRKGKLRQKLGYIGEKFPPEIIGWLREACRNSETGELSPNGPEIAGFEKIGLSNEKLGELWSEKFYPRGVIEGGVTRVSYDDTAPQADPKYNIYAQKAAKADSATGEIFFYQGAGKVSDRMSLLETLDWHFSHELGHLADWDSMRDLSPEARVEFLSEVAEAFQKPGSFRDPLGAIDYISNSDKQIENYLKTSEYWANLCQSYLTFPEYSREVFSPEEMGLIEKWLLLRDQHFDPVKAHAERGGFISQNI